MSSASTAAGRRHIGFTELKEKYLPQRYPLLLLDRVTGFVPGEWIEAIKAVTGNSPELVGHFPERAILPGSAMMQAFSQLAIVFFKITNGELAQDELTVVTSFKIRLLAPVPPGEILRFRLAAKKVTPAVVILRGEAAVGDARVAVAAVTIAKTTVASYGDIPW
jgi:3-hydroxyacyl-[acyl-carrier-protein] dehydratase